MCLWLWDGYQKYAACIFVVSVMGVVESLYETISNINRIIKMARFECQVEVKRRDRNN